jgi:penicillin-binding protein 2
MDTGKNKDHSWFVSYAPAYKPEIALVALIENSGFGGAHAAPAVRGVYDVYYRNTRHEDPPGAVPQIAKKETPTTPKQTSPAPKRIATTAPAATQQQAVVRNQ